jgi:hypothetical protein
MSLEALLMSQRLQCADFGMPNTSHAADQIAGCAQPFPGVDDTFDHHATIIYESNSPGRQPSSQSS